MKEKNNTPWSIPSIASLGEVVKKFPPPITITFFSSVSADLPSAIQQKILDLEAQLQIIWNARNAVLIQANLELEMIARLASNNLTPEEIKEFKATLAEIQDSRFLKKTGYRGDTSFTARAEYLKKCIIHLIMRIKDLQESLDEDVYQQPEPQPITLTAPPDVLRAVRIARMIHPRKKRDPVVRYAS